ncbi:MAG: metal-dependent transcriptional regulator [Clostridiales bacterium]|nr:metal-dependent transcriptional regulator [Clostridiales bacterium]MBR0469380.1 metal-dependent transcriptional regulator [Mogibacterium sp.]
MKIRKSAEDYLEAMLVLQEEHGYIRSIDIAKKLGVTKPSVSYAVKRLRESGYINMEANGPITLAPAGYKIAKRIYERHKALTAFLEKLGVSREQAEEDACKIEHDISHETYVAICDSLNEGREEKLGSYDFE